MCLRKVSECSFAFTWTEVLAVLYRCMLNSTIRFSFFLYFCVFVCVCFMFVLFSLSIFFLLCSMGQVAWNKTDDDDLPATLCVAGNNSSSVFVQWPWVTYNPHFKVTILVNVTLSLWIVSRQKFFFRKFIFFSLSDAKKFAGFYGTTIFEIWQKNGGDIGVGWRIEGGHCGRGCSVPINISVKHHKMRFFCHHPYWKIWQILIL